MPAIVTVENHSTESAPSEDDIRRWISAALTNHRPESTIDVRLVDAAESAELNRHYRGKNGPTNVLAFAAELPAWLESPLLGDIVVCSPLVIAEARQQGKHVQAHWAHLLVHGTLHLLGYDHKTDKGASQMESLETRVLTALNFPPPYAEDDRDQSQPS